MRRNILYLLSIGICLFTCVGSHAAAPETRAHLERGRSLFDHGRWTDARYELLKAREGADRDDRLTLQQIDYQLAVCALKLGSRDAEAMLADFSKRYPESVYNNDLRFAQGLLYCSRSEYDKALACFGRVNYRALDRTRREQYDLRMGYIEFGRDDYDRAMTYFDRINPQSEFYDHALYYKSYIAYAREQYDWARSGFERLLKSEAYGEVAPYYLLQIEFKQGNYRYVVENGEELIRRASPRQRAELSRVMAEAWFRLGEYSKPLDYLDAFVQAGGEMGRDENYLYGFSLYRTARYDDAAEYLRKACGADDALTQNASYHLADCYLRGGDKQQAMQSFAMASNADSIPRLPKTRCSTMENCNTNWGADVSTKRFRYSTAMSPSIRRRPVYARPKSCWRRPITIRTITTKRTRSSPPIPIPTATCWPPSRRSPISAA